MYLVEEMPRPCAERVGASVYTLRARLLRSPLDGLPAVAWSMWEPAFFRAHTRLRALTLRQAAPRHVLLSETIRPAHRGIT
jgi:hypothetical protein